MGTNKRFSLALGVGLALLAEFTIPAQTTPKQHLRGNVPEAVTRFHLQPTGRPSPTKRMHLAIGLPLRNQQALDDLLRQIYDPASPNFRQYLTPEQFTEQFGPTEQDYQAVVAFMKANGLAVTTTHPNRVVLDVQGAVADIERVFNVTMRTYPHPKEARTFYAPDVEPSINVLVPVLHVSGLNDYSLPHPNFKIKPDGQAAGVAPASGSGPFGGSYRGNDFRAAYVPGVSLTGSGQIVGLLQFDGYYSNDIAAYVSQAGLPSVTLTNVPINGGVITPGSGNGEVCLDIEMVISMAPGVSKIIVYEAPNPSPWPDLLNRMANDNLAKQLSCSWGGGSPDPTSEQIFKQMAVQGQSFFSASGDSDAFVGTIEFPSESTNITQVGGTTLSTSGPGGSYVGETVWNDRTVNPNGGYWGSSGGISTTYPIPVWQQGISMTTNQGSTTMRNIPDVALTGDNVYVVYNNGVSNSFGGTSCAAPLWAGFTALVNQQAVSKGKPTVGFVNPAIYTIGKGPNYAADFHDVTTGDNTWPSSPTKFYAVTGYDLCTGWGTPNGLNLINALATPDAFGIMPGTGFNAIGPVGGPFTATTQNYSLTNSGGTSFNWSLLGKPSWLDVSSVGGTLVAGGSATVTVNLNLTGYSLPAGIYTTNLTFTNLNSSLAQLRQFTLQVGQSVLQNGGFETGDFSYWTLTSDAYSQVENGSVSGMAPHSGTYLAALGQSGSLGYLSQTLPTVANQAYLLSLWFNSPFRSGGNTPNEFKVSWNGTTLFDQVNIGAIGWTNLVFIVTATSSSTVLQFGERVDPWYLGLDDVNVWPIPNPSFRSVVKTNGNNIVFSWNSLAGIAYQVQYSTNLIKTNWTILSTNIATGPILTLTNSYGTDPRRFYRIRQLP